MPRIFHVTISQEADFTIVADSEEECQAALDATNFDDWGLDAWQSRIHDPLKRLTLKRLTLKTIDRVDDRARKSDMGVIGSEILDISDVLDRRPTILDEVEQEVKAIKCAITLDDRQEKLFK